MKPRSMIRWWVLHLGGLLAQLVPAALHAQADAVSVAYLQGKQPVAQDAIATLGPDLFGDKLNLFNGSLQFEQTDFDLPGNSGLPVALVRQHSPGRMYYVRGAMADWDLNTPRIEATLEATDPWGPSNGNRCSAFDAPPGLTRSGADFLPHEYWHGTNLVIPGQGSQEILTRAYGNNLRPTDGADYPLVTTKNWQISCLSNLQNAAGQGFVAVSPEGVRYRFDWKASRMQMSAKKGRGILQRRDFYLMATQVTDRFGNWVLYTYDSVNPLNLKSIQASDGHLITLTYAGGRVATASDQTRTWQYFYSPQGDLQFVQQPDGSRWQFDLRPMIYLNTAQLGEGEGQDCDSMAEPAPGTYVGTMTHPSGALGKFTTGWLIQGRTNVPRACYYIPGTDWTTGPVWARSTANQALISKEISGPGMQTMTWSYRGGGNDPFGEWAPCSVCQDRKTVAVTEPSGAVTRHTFGILWQVNEGQLLQVDEGWAGGSALKTTVNNYRSSASGQAYPDRFGDSVFFASDYLSTRNRPQDLRRVTQQGVNFTWQANSSPAGFDAFAKPLVATSSSSLGFSRTDITAYENNLALWVLGQTQSVTEQTTGLQVEAHAYTQKAQRQASFEFGRPTHTFTYNPDGTLATLLDGAGHATGFQNFKRGQPQGAAFADGSAAQRQINNLGNVDWITNEAGTTTNFNFDAMGRVSRIIYPPGDPVTYDDTTQRFEQVWFAEFDLPAGHWRQAITTGNAVRMRWFDAMFRVRLELKQDAASPGATSAYVETRYDAAGREAFESYPVRNFSAVNGSLPGKTFSYDGLNRVVRQVADSELGPLVTTTDYLGGFQRRVTNPRGFATQYAFQAFDNPTEDHITQITAPEGVTVTVTIARDTFGKPVSITRGGNGLSATRRYAYDNYQRLCLTIEPETGATLQTYDEANNVQWRASGLPVPSGLNCAQVSVPDARKVNFGYDARNRLTSTSYGDGSPGSVRTYTPDGLLSRLTSSNTTWTYTYYNRRLPKAEQYTWWTGGSPGQGWDFTWRLDAHGHVDALSDPWGTLFYSPNALGHPTQVSGYADNITYHPNGQVAGYTLNNTRSFSSTQNLRGLPDLWQLGGIASDRYSYDANGNVSRIDDLQEGINTRSMGYDGLDRLTTANGPWGGGTYGYDTLDNLLTSTVGGRTLTHQINYATNRLDQISGSQSLGIGYDANGNISQRGAQSYSFDIGNRMQAAPGKISYFIYDGHGRRSQTGTADGNWRLYAYGQQGKLLFSYRTDEQQYKRYVYLGEKLISETATTATTYSHTDALGSPVARMNSIGALIDRTRYEPYGATASGTIPTSIGFTGHVNDVDTGLVYMQQRYYEPIAGRFLSVDPVTTDAKSGGNFNRYHYANNNPYKFKDPDGRFPWGIVAGIAVEIGYQMTVEGRSIGNLDVSNILVAGAIGAILPGAGSAAIHGAQAVPKVAQAMRALNTLSGKAANTTNRAAKTAEAMARNTEKAAKAVGDAAADATKAGAGVALKNEVQNAVNSEQAKANDPKSEPPPPPPKENPR